MIADSFYMVYRTPFHGQRGIRARCARFALIVLAILSRPGPTAAQSTIFASDASNNEVRIDRPAPDFDLDLLVELVHQLVNQERVRHGVAPLNRDYRLERVSYRHSRDMGTNGYFDHLDLKGRNATERAQSDRYQCLAGADPSRPVTIGENLFAGFQYSEYTLTYHVRAVEASFAWVSEREFAQETVKAWMDSPPHRRNLLHPDYKSEGIGIYLTRERQVFVTQSFC